jgi:hypothetical protein
MERNPVRDAAPISTKVKRKPRSLTTIAEVRQLRAILTYDDRAIGRDLPDLIDIMLATSLRVGEAAAIRWSSIDLDPGTIQVGDGIVVRSRGQGLVIRSGDSKCFHGEESRARSDCAGCTTPTADPGTRCCSHRDNAAVLVARIWEPTQY